MKKGLRIKEVDLKTINNLKKSFEIICNSFHILEGICITFNMKIPIKAKKMQVLSEMMLKELESENPNKIYINNLLAQMENIAKQNSKKN